jgi:hypothetical protein
VCDHPLFAYRWPFVSILNKVLSTDKEVPRRAILDDAHIRDSPSYLAQFAEGVGDCPSAHTEIGTLRSGLKFRGELIGICTPDKEWIRKTRSVGGVWEMITFASLSIASRGLIVPSIDPGLWVMTN